MPAEPNVNGFAISLMFIIVLALFLGMFLYQKIVQWAFNKFNLEDKLDPLFKKKYNWIKLAKKAGGVKSIILNRLLVLESKLLIAILLKMKMIFKL